MLVAVLLRSYFGRLPHASIYVLMSRVPAYRSESKVFQLSAAWMQSEPLKGGHFTLIWLEALQKGS